MLTSPVIVSLVVGSLFASEVSARAQTVDDSLERVRAALALGERLTVVDADGAKVTGALMAVSERSLRVRARGGVREIAFQDVSEVRRQRDSPWNGFLIGAALGAAVGFGTYEECVPEPPERVCGSNLTRSRGMETAAAAALFGATGLTLDLLMSDASTIYRARPSKTRVPVRIRIAPDRVDTRVVLRF